MTGPVFKFIFLQKTPDNVFDAIKDISPFAVDVSSGVEKSKGVKDRQKLRKFIEICREA